MIYQEIVTIPAKKIVVEIKVAQCIKCESEDVFVKPYEDQYGFITTIKCNNCGQELRENCGSAATIEVWNKRNDIDTLIQDKSELILKTQKDIKDLNILKRERIKREKAKKS